MFENACKHLGLKASPLVQRNQSNRVLWNALLQFKRVAPKEECFIRAHWTNWAKSIHNLHEQKIKSMPVHVHDVTHANHHLEQTQAVIYATRILQASTQKSYATFATLPT
jgi:hypothetical protein